jgi:RHS repeat-associated protein
MSNLIKRIARPLIAIVLLFTFVVNPVLAAVTYSYDPNGNMTSDSQNCYEYNEANQLKRVKNCSNNQLIAEYVYDFSGRRIVVKEYENGTLKQTTYAPDKEYEVKKLADNTTQNTSYFFANGQLAAKKNPDGTINFFQDDHLGSNSIVTDISGALLESTTYYPYGETKTGATLSKYQFTGQEKDPTGLYYYGARFYNPHIAHFTQADTLLANVYDPQQLNRYAYARNNPVIYTDPSGHFIILPFLIIGIGAAAFGYVDEYNQRSEYAAANNTSVSDTLTDPNFHLDTGRVGSAAVKGAGAAVVAMAMAPVVVSDIGGILITTGFLAKNPDLVSKGTNLAASAEAGFLGLFAGNKTEDVGVAETTTISQSTTTTVHNNSLKSQTPTVGYKIIQNDTDRLLKNGITVNPPGRYSPSFYLKYNARMEMVTGGNRAAVYEWEAQENQNYKDLFGKWPELNRNGH